MKAAVRAVTTACDLKREKQDTNSDMQAFRRQLDHLHCRNYG